jgi:uncharacterized protein DUF4124
MANVAALGPSAGLTCYPALDYLGPVSKVIETPPRERREQSHVRPRAALVAAAVALVAGLAAVPVFAALYKWTDANGRVIYSDQPPPGNVKVETLNAPPPPANPNVMKDLAAKDAELRKSKQARADDEAKANKARVDANQLRENCQRARGQMYTLGNSDQIVIYSTNAQGERVPMDDAARVRERERLDAWIRDNCKS